MTEPTKTETQFTDDPVGWQARLQMELNAARKEAEPWWKQCEAIIKRLRDDRVEQNRQEARLNVFPANMQTLGAMMYGKTPRIDVVRRYNDSQDDVARVAGEILERLLNTDIARGYDSYRESLKDVLSDRLSIGFGSGRLMYEEESSMTEEKPAKTEMRPDPTTGEMVQTELAPAVPPVEQMDSQDVHFLYHYWRDQLWSPCRTEGDKRWHAFKLQLTREQGVKKFGDVFKGVQLNTPRGASPDATDGVRADPWSRADVWQIWDKEHRCVWHVVEGFDQVLVPVDAQEKNPNGSIGDPYELDGFWPFPKPMYANLTTSKLIPVPDFKFVQDLYDEVDVLTSRIRVLEDVIRVAGVYDKTAEGVQQLVTQGADNQLIPIKGWMAFTEKGGLGGLIQWLPLEAIVAALNVLREMRTEALGFVYQISGYSDIMRGQAAEQATATEQSIKARFGAVRIQHLQDEFARYASDAQYIKAQLICKFFEASTIIQRSNIMLTNDAPLAEKAVEFLKSNLWCYRVEVKPENVSLTDYAALRQERTEVITAVGGYISAVQPLVQASPDMAPVAMSVLQWLVSGIRGASEIESVMDQAIVQMKQQAAMPKPPPPPDPKMLATQAKVQGDLLGKKLDGQNRQQEIAAETKSAIVQTAVKGHIEIQSAEAKERAKAQAAVDQITQGGA